MDNAENNTSMMDQLADLLNEREPPLEFVAKDRCIMCFTHIINLCIQDVISGFTAANVADDLAWAWRDDTEEKDEYIEAMRGNPLALAHYTVRAIHASGIQCDKFMSLIANRNRGQWFKSPDGETTIVPDLQLLHDVKTRWDSTFLMVNRLCALQPTADLFVTLPLQQKELEKVKISDAEWSVLQDYENILKMKEYCHLKVPEDAITQSSSQFDLLDVLAQQFNICDMALGGLRPTEQQSVREEYQLYIDGGYVLETTDPLKFWEVNQMVFSSSAETDTKKHNWISPILMEALQMLKYHLKQEWLDFMVNWTISPESLVEDEPEELAKGTRRHDIQLSSLDTLLDRSVAEDGDDLSIDVEIFV
ncbi:hypothetical protein PISMIDRAFT_5833 [Pisolithus microcarpus 441]|uniref:Unplaced genomic scaffold scaffold_1, whole genome shotgun sequence n=1 Tax=Pisolithus microcarpus 441 TaxID=765257 RepID=A0A0C9Z1G1_9AGAM|nr:hypothetical protein PISMIDRAFT_5833 [Pisolithus microcarpus 441]